MSGFVKTQQPQPQPQPQPQSQPVVTARLPSDITMRKLSKLAIDEDKPIMFDYWTPSIEKTVLIGVKKVTNDEGKQVEEKLLVRNEEEYTSTISNIYKSETELIVVTENSIYIVDIKIPVKRIS